MKLHKQDPVRVKCDSTGIRKPPLLIGYTMKDLKEKPHAVNFCGKRRASKNSFSFHVNSAHLRVKYACEQSEEGHKAKEKLNVHVKNICRGVKYSCDLCEKTYTASSSLNAHVNNVHLGRRHACDQCEKSYTTKFSLTRHVKAFHH